MSTATEQQTGITTESELEEAGLLGEIIREGRMARDASQREYAKDLVGEFARQVLDEGMVIGKDLDQTIKEQVEKLDKLITDQLALIIQDRDFKTLEASWRGLHYFVKNTEIGPNLRIRVLNGEKREFILDVEKAVDFDQSALFKKVYEQEYGTFGGAPYGLLVGDFEIGRHPQDMEFLRKVAGVAAAAHAPFIAAASPKMFDFDDYTELDNPRDLSKIMESSELAKWRSFRDTDDSKYVALVLPHMMLRLPYGPDTLPADGIPNFSEGVDGSDHSKYLWGNAAYALGTRITEAFAKHKWCAAIRGVEGGGVVEDLPLHYYKSETGDTRLKCPAEQAVTDRREKELNDLGFISLVHCKDTDTAAFFGGQTANKPKVYASDLANSNARISSMLPYVMAASRFAHYLKVIMRDKIGSFTSQSQISDYLNNWISNYVLLDDNAGQDAKAKFPLREARVDVQEIPGKPGCYNAVVFLRPHFQLEELTASIRLVAELPEPAA